MTAGQLPLAQRARSRILPQLTARQLAKRLDEMSYRRMSAMGSVADIPGSKGHARSAPKADIAGARKDSGLSAIARQGPVEGEPLCEDPRAAPTEDIWCEKIIGCNCRETTRLTAPCSRCNISFVSSRERKFGLVLRPARCKFCRRPGRGHSVSNQFKRARRGPQSANALRDIFRNQPPEVGAS
jgi:hypothetical protein